MLSVRSKDGETIAILDGGLAWLGIEEHTDGWWLYINGVKMRGFDFEAEAHYALDQIWEDIKKESDRTINLMDEIYTKPVRKNSEYEQLLDETLDTLDCCD